MKNRQLLTHSRNSQDFMKSGSLLYHQSATSLCPEPDQSTTYHQLISIRSISTASYHLYPGLPSGLFPSDFRIKTLYALIHHAYDIPCPWYSPSLLHSNYIWWEVQIMKLLRKCAVFSNLLFHSSWVQIISSAPYSQLQAKLDRSGKRQF
jgi:hypothetical protein